MLSFAEAEGIWAEDDVAFEGESDAGMVHGVAGESGGFDFTEVVGAVVLVPDGDGGGGVIGVDAIGDEEIGGDAVVGFDVVGDVFEAVALFLGGMSEEGFEFRGLRPGSAEALEEFCLELLGGNGGLGVGWGWVSVDHDCGRGCLCEEPPSRVERMGHERPWEERLGETIAYMAWDSRLGGCWGDVGAFASGVGPCKIGVEPNL